MTDYHSFDTPSPECIEILEYRHNHGMILICLWKEDHDSSYTMSRYYDPLTMYASNWYKLVVTLTEVITMSMVIVDDNTTDT